MNLAAHFKNAVRSLDEKLAGHFSPTGHEGGTLLSFLFHGLFENERELQSGLLDPQQGVTVAMFREFLGHFHSQGYRFVSPAQILDGLPPASRCVLLTFDDGYFNNLRALPVLEEFQAPALFFISSDHIGEGKAFWWDVLYRESRKRGRTADQIQRAFAVCKRQTSEDVERELLLQFGGDALRPIADLDRPFTPAELCEFASHRLVHLGNHTKNHAILTNYAPAEIRKQIVDAQQAILEMTGKIPLAISYPNGNSTPEIRQCAREAGLRLGVLVRPGRNRLPLSAASPEAMMLRRFTLWGTRPVEEQCRVSRSRFSLQRFFQHAKAVASSASR